VYFPQKLFWSRAFLSESASDVRRVVVGRGDSVFRCSPTQSHVFSYASIQYEAKPVAGLDLLIETVAFDGSLCYRDSWKGLSSTEGKYSVDCPLKR
jgi:hypothetical protein